MRRCYLVSYDIRDPKRLQRVNRILKGYGTAWQYSVFYCNLKEIDRIRLQADIEEQINQREDQVMILDLGANEERVFESLQVIGVAIPEPNSGILVI